MKLIVGLGNPGTRYERTRHNIGFEVIAQLARQHQIKVSGALGPSLIGRGRIAGEPVCLMQPTTYMNRSGEAVVRALRQLDVALHDVLVIHDDLDLPVGRIRLRAAGGSGGHRGIKSIIAALGTEDFNRLRIGIDHPGEGDVADYVLERFSQSEQTIIDETIQRAATAVEVWVREGLDRAASVFNQKKNSLPGRPSDKLSEKDKIE
jgi:PTH1 family peptidyl-tRNA hydrolase